MDVWMFADIQYSQYSAVLHWLKQSNGNHIKCVFHFLYEAQRAKVLQHSSHSVLLM